MSCDDSVADPGFPRGGAPTPKVDVKSYFWPINFFLKNCMTLKEFEPRRGWAYLETKGDIATIFFSFLTNLFNLFKL